MKKAIILAIIVVIAVFAVMSKWDYILKKIYKTEYSEYVEKYSKENDVDPYLIYAIIKAESNFNEKAMSSKGACGLMQLMENTAKEVAQNTAIEYDSETTLYNPEKNIELGVKYFKDLKDKFNNTELALAAYNAGIGNVNNWIEQGILNEDGSNIENIPYKETNMYVRKIVRDHKIYKKLYME